MKSEDITTEQPTVWVLVLNYNGRDVIDDCLRTVRASDYPNIEICVIDNASEDGSTEWMAERYEGIHTLFNKQNLGFGGANNVGIRHALEQGADYLWILNNDVEIEPDCISKLVHFMEAHPEPGIVSPLIYYMEPKDRVWFAGAYVDFDNFTTTHMADTEAFAAHPIDSRYVTGCAMFVRRSVCETVGVLDERFLFYFDDADYCITAAKQGILTAMVPEAVLYHKVSAYSGGEETPSPFRTYNVLRSGLLFWRKHLGWKKFHRVYCDGHLAKWLVSVDRRLDGELEQAISDAVIDALWFYFFGNRKARVRIHAARWFRRFVEWKPWVIGRLMAHDPLAVLIPRRSRQRSE